VGRTSPLPAGRSALAASGMADAAITAVAARNTADCERIREPASRPARPQGYTERSPPGTTRTPQNMTIRPPRSRIVHEVSLKVTPSSCLAQWPHGPQTALSSRLQPDTGSWGVPPQWPGCSASTAPPRGRHSLRPPQAASATKPGKPGPSRPPGSRKRRPATHHDVRTVTGKTARKAKTSTCRPRRTG